MTKMPPEFSVIIVSYNSSAVLRACLSSVLDKSPELTEVIVVDNASEDESRQLVQEEFPQVQLEVMERNEGFGAGANRGAEKASGRYLVFLNPDTVVEASWLPPLAETLESDESIGAVSPKIVLMDNPGRINACGNDVHVLGMPSCHLRGERSVDVNDAREVTSISGACFCILRNQFNSLGGFATDYFMYLEDTDLSWRLRLAGLRCWFAPHSVVHHQYAPVFTPEKFFQLERNRYLLIARYLSTRTIIALEVCAWGYAAMRGRQHLAAKWSALSCLMGDFRRMRRNNISIHQNVHSQRTLLQSCTVCVPYDVVANGLFARVAAVICNTLSAIGLWIALALLKIGTKQGENVPLIGKGLSV